MISIFVDDATRILGMCFDDMTGNTGWINVEDTVITAHTGSTIDAMFNHLSNNKGIPILKYVEGFAENRSPEEIAADEAAIPVEPEEATETDYQEALNRLGVELDEENDIE